MSTTDLVRQEAREVTQGEPQNMLALIARAVADPSLDVAKMQALLDMKMQIDARDAEMEFNAALARLMPKIPRIQRHGVILNASNRGGGVRSRYAFYEDIDAAVRPLLAQEGFAISFDTDDSIPGQVRIVGTLAHRMGFSRKSQTTLPINNPVISGAQAVGATISYGKRYIVTNLLNIITVGQDTDGNATETITEDQCMTIETLLKDTGRNKAKFLEWAGVDTVDQILKAKFEEIVSVIQTPSRRSNG